MKNCKKLLEKKLTKNKERERSDLAWLITTYKKCVLECRILLLYLKDDVENLSESLKSFIQSNLINNIVSKLKSNEMIMEKAKQDITVTHPRNREYKRWKIETQTSFISFELTCQSFLFACFISREDSH